MQLQYLAALCPRCVLSNIQYYKFYKRSHILNEESNDFGLKQFRSSFESLQLLFAHCRCCCIRCFNYCLFRRKFTNDSQFNYPETLTSQGQTKTLSIPGSFREMLLRIFLIDIMYLLWYIGSIYGILMGFSKTT